MKRFFVAILIFVLLCSALVVGCIGSNEHAFAAESDSYSFKVDGREVTLNTTELSDGVMRVRYRGYFFGNSDIPVTVQIYSSPIFPVNFHIGKDNLTANQLATRNKLQALFTDIVRFIDHVDDLSNVLFDGTSDYGNVTECFSDVYRYNHASAEDERTTEVNGVYTIEIAKETYEMLTLAQEMYLSTNGAFNPAVYRLVDLWGFSSRIYSYRDYSLPYDRQWNKDYSYPLPEQKYIDAFSKAGFTDFGEEAVKLEERDGKYYVTKNVAPVVVQGDKGDESYEQWIDLGGIAKGYAVDVVKGMLADAGIDRFNVDAGSSSIGFGFSSTGGETSLGISDAFSYGKSVFRVRVPQSSISTSGQNIRRYKVDDVEYSHIIDGVKGAPAQTGVKSVTVVVPDEVGSFWATKGDCLTTALTVLGYDGIVEFIQGYFKDNGIKVVVQYQLPNGDRQLITNYEPSEIDDLLDDYRDFEWNDSGFYVATSRINFRVGDYTWILIVLGALLGVGAIALIAYHFVRGKKRAATNVQNAKKDKPFKVLDVMVYMVVALLIMTLFLTFVLDTDDSEMQIISVIDDETGETLFVYNVTMDSYMEKRDNLSGWTIERKRVDDGLEITFSRKLKDEKRFNVVKITLGDTPSVKMADSVCGFHQDCVRNFPAITRPGGAIVCSPNRLKIVTE